MKKILRAMVAALMVLTLMVPPAMAQESIKVGIILPVTGDKAKFGGN